MNSYTLPTSLTVCGHEYKIRTDYRDIINLMIALVDPDLDDDTKIYVFFKILFLDPVLPAHTEQAYKAGMDFIGAGIKDSGAPSPRLMDWEQDAPLIMPAINKVAGKEVRAVEYMHWWTFLGLYMEIGESQFATVINIRQKLQKHKPLEKHEKEYYRQNKAVVDLKKKISSEDLDALDELIGWRDDDDQS